jgi:hypothetical protein
MAVGHCCGLSVDVCTESATPHEVALVQQTLAEIFVVQPDERLIGENAIPIVSTIPKIDALCVATPTMEDKTLHFGSRTFRRLTVRGEHSLENFVGMIHLACAIILLRHL